MYRSNTKSVEKKDLECYFSFNEKKNRYQRENIIKFPTIAKIRFKEIKLYCRNVETQTVFHNILL